MMKIFSATAVVTCLMVLAGCATQQQAATFAPLPFDAVEYSALPASGTGVVRGQLFAKTRGGDVKKGAGANVVIFPATKYGQQRYIEQVIGGKLAATTPDPRYKQNVVVKTADGDGRFEFADVPAGTYYIFGNLTWSTFAPTRYSDGETSHGGIASMKIEVKNGATTDAMLSP